MYLLQKISNISQSIDSASILSNADPSNFFDGSHCSQRESFYDRYPNGDLDRKLIKYQREEENREEKKVRLIVPVWHNCPCRPRKWPRSCAARRRIKRAWASTFRANSAFDDLRPRRIEPFPLSPRSHPRRPLFPRIAADGTRQTRRNPDAIADFARAHYTYTNAHRLPLPESHIQLYAWFPCIRPLVVSRWSRSLTVKSSYRIGPHSR